MENAQWLLFAVFIFGFGWLVGVGPTESREDAMLRELAHEESIVEPYKEEIETLENCVYEHESDRSEVYSLLEESLYELEYGDRSEAYGYINEATAYISGDPC